MMRTHWDRRLFASTRGRLVRLLCRAPATVNDLARALGLTENAVRAQLAGLVRDGFVRQSGFRPGLRRPFGLYRLTPLAERLFPRPYALLLRQLLAVLAQRLPPGELESVLHDVGRRTAAENGTSGEGSLPSRVRRGAAFLEELGGVTQIEESAGAFVIRGSCCPLSAVVSDRPEACLMAEALLAEVIGAPVRQACSRDDPPRCVFRVVPAA